MGPEHVASLRADIEALLDFTWKSASSHADRVRRNSGPGVRQRAAADADAAKVFGEVRADGFDRVVRVHRALRELLGDAWGAGVEPNDDPVAQWHEEREHWAGLLDPPERCDPPDEKEDDQ